MIEIPGWMPQTCTQVRSTRLGPLAVYLHLTSSLRAAKRLENQELVKSPSPLREAGGESVEGCQSSPVGPAHGDARAAVTMPAIAIVEGVRIEQPRGDRPPPEIVSPSKAR